MEPGSGGIRTRVQKFIANVIVHGHSSKFGSRFILMLRKVMSVYYVFSILYKSPHIKGGASYGDLPIKRHRSTFGLGVLFGGPASCRIYLSASGLRWLWGYAPKDGEARKEPPNRLRTGKLSLATDVGDVLCRKSGCSNSTICAIYNSLAFIFGAQLAKRRTVTLAPQLLSKPFGPVM